MRIDREQSHKHKLKRMNRYELLNLAEEHGIEQPGRFSVPQLRAMLEASLTALDAIEAADG